MADRKEIFVFSQNFVPSSLADAVRMTSVVDYFNSLGHDVYLFTQTKESKQLESAKLKIYFLQWVTPKNTDRNLIRLLKEIVLGFEIFLRLLFLRKKAYYFFTSPPYISSVIGLVATFFKKGELIFDVRDIYPDIYLKQGIIKNRGLIHHILTSVEKLVYNKSAIVLAATDGLRETISKRTISKVILLRNGYSKFFSISDEKFKNFTIVFHGSLSKFQNIELLVELVKELNIKSPDINFVVIGSGPKETLLRNDMPPNFVFHGRKSNADTAEIVKKCHLGLSLRDNSQISIDSFPVKLYEYVGAGIPSIATPICEGGEILSALNIGYNIPNDKAEIIKLILNLRNDSVVYQKIVTNIAMNREKFSRDNLTSSALVNVIS